MKKYWTQKEAEILNQYPKISIETIAKKLGRTPNSVESKLNRMGLFRIMDPLADPISEDLDKMKNQRIGVDIKDKYKDALMKIEQLEIDKMALLELKENFDTYKILPKSFSNESEATAVAVVSDWHIEEPVKSSAVNNLNNFNLDIAKKRADYLFQVISSMIKMYGRDIKINNLVLALLGDFITGSIHDDNKEANTIQPIEAIWIAQNMIASGIEHLLKYTKCNIVIPCCSGNHSRITEKQRMSTEYGNSLETLMYLNLSAIFAKEPRIKFVINDSHLVYLDVYNYTLRFHHGHAIKYSGGMGGIFVPTFKAISQWNKAQKADYDFFGHVHQMKDGGNFLSNGSLIGWNQFAIRIKADYERPKQAFCLIDKKRGKTLTAPIVLD